MLPGNIYVGALDGVQVFNPKGKLIGKILMPKETANLTFGGKDNNILFICSSNSIWAIKLNVKGAKPVQEIGNLMKKSEITAVYSAGLIQGIALVAFPAASTIFTNPHEFNFSSTAYGSLFIPQVVIAISRLGLSTKLRKHYGSKLVFFSGLIANLIAMALLAFSAVVMHEPSLAYWYLTGCNRIFRLGLWPNCTYDKYNGCFTVSQKS